MAKLRGGHANGHWLILNNIHLMPRWLVECEKELDRMAMEGSHQNFRLFLTSEPTPYDPVRAIPIGILARSIKLTMEAPAGLNANLKRGFNFFDPDDFDELDNRSKSIMFGMCHFHAVFLERKKFGPKGFNMMYPFSLGDLRDGALCLNNYMIKKINLFILRILIGVMFIYSGWAKVSPIEPLEFTLLEYTHLPWFLNSIVARFQNHTILKDTLCSLFDEIFYG